MAEVVDVVGFTSRTLMQSGAKTISGTKKIGGVEFDGEVGEYDYMNLLLHHSA